MSRSRLAIAAVTIILFVAAGAFVVASNLHHGAGSVTFNVTVTGASHMTPSSLSAHQNDTVTINVTSDQTGEVHLHVYDIPFNAVAGTTVSHTFKADKTCTCDIEWESTSTPLGTLVVSP